MGQGSFALPPGQRNSAGLRNRLAQFAFDNTAAPPSFAPTPFPMAGSSDPKLANRILTGLVIGVLAGVITLLLGPKIPIPEGLQGLFTHIGIKSSASGLELMRGVSTVALDPFGKIFLRLLFFVIIPLVFASLATGVVQLGRPDKLGPLAGKTFFFFFLNMAIGVGLGLVMMNVLQPGDHIDAATKDRLMAEFGGAAQKHVQTQAGQSGLSFNVIVEMFMPANLFAAVVGQSTARIGDVLPLILFAILVGWFGGGLVAVLNEKISITFQSFFVNLRLVVELADVFNGLFKSAVFAVVIGTVCCHQGLVTIGGPRGIGRSVTKAVVNSIVLILILDYFLTRLLMHLEK